MSTEQNVFRFDLNESLYFEKGQEVSEMIKISLDPEISIQAFSEYVSIRGVVELQGEYRKLQIVDEEDYTLNFEDYHSHRYMEKIEDTADGNALFSHRFPVEISVPSYRVDDINDITVNIESFDYEIPNENQLKLSSSIKIKGISEHAEVAKPGIAKEEMEKEADFDNEKEEDETFEFEVEQIQEAESSNESELIHPADIPELPVEIEAETDTETGPNSPDKVRWKFKKVQSFEDFFNQDKTVINNDNNKVEEYPEVQSKIQPVEDDDPEVQSKIQPVEDDDPEVQSKVQSKVQPVEDDDPPLKELSENTEETANISGERKVVDTESIETDSPKDVSYLADIFRDNDTEELYTKMRICIVQDNDTIESIAERYKIPKSQILQQNRLEDEDLLQGQLLSIPYRKK